MEGWKLAQLKAHQQFILGRIDALRWTLGNLSLNEQIKKRIHVRIKELNDTERECSGYIEKIMAKRAEEKQEVADRKAENHRNFGAQ